jgi:hypothetical protein
MERAVKHMHPVNVPVVKPAPTPPKPAARTSLAKTRLAGEEKQEGDGFSVGSATDGQARRHRHRPPRETASSPAGPTATGKPSAEDPTTAASPRVNLAGDALKLLLELQEADSNAVPSVTRSADWPD